MGQCIAMAIVSSEQGQFQSPILHIPPDQAISDHFSSPPPSAESHQKAHLYSPPPHQQTSSSDQGVLLASRESYSKSECNPYSRSTSSVVPQTSYPALSFVPMYL